MGTMAVARRRATVTSSSAMRHARCSRSSKRSGCASRATCTTDPPSRVSVVIKDDGQGFDVARTEANLHKNKNLGLLSMRERAELEKGTLEIRSQPGRGTEVKVEVPLAKH